MSNTMAIGIEWWSHLDYVIPALAAVWIVATFGGYVHGQISFEFAVISLLTLLAVK